MASKKVRTPDNTKGTDNEIGLRTDLIRSTRNFSEQEIICPCCATGGLTPKMATRLQALRDHLDFPLKITSGYRCQKYNDSLSNSAKRSQHLSGKAVDVLTTEMSGTNKKKLLKSAKDFGFKGIGVYPSHVHIDLRDGNFTQWTKFNYES